MKTPTRWQMQHDRERKNARVGARNEWESLTVTAKCRGAR
jgi:hypothetical protein